MRKCETCQKAGKTYYFCILQEKDLTKKDKKVFRRNIEPASICMGNNYKYYKKER